MSGPITRQYGVPNWDDIFGKKDPDEANPKVTRTEDQPSSQAPSKEQAQENETPSTSN